MNILSFLNLKKDDTANIAKRRLQIAVGKASLDIDSMVSELQSVINHALSKYAIQEDTIEFSHTKKKNKVQFKVGVEY